MAALLEAVRQEAIVESAIEAGYDADQIDWLLFRDDGTHQSCFHPNQLPHRRKMLLDLAARFEAAAGESRDPESSSQFLIPLRATPRPSEPVLALSLDLDRVEALIATTEAAAALLSHPESS